MARFRFYLVNIGHEPQKFITVAMILPQTNSSLLFSCAIGFFGRKNGKTTAVGNIFVVWPTVSKEYIFDE